jgi:oxygen-independent coproporphyrinogen-3 oxidase
VPGQTLTDLEQDLAAVIALSPDHVSAYCLTWEDGTPFSAWRASGRLHPVDEELEAAMAEATAAAFTRAGYVRYEISSWARPGFASRHNTSYWDGSDYLGLGAGAHSFSATPASGRRWANLRRPEAYRAAVDTTGTAVDQDERLSATQARTDFVITGLRQMAGIDPAAFARRFGEALADSFPQVDELVRDGLLEHAGSRLRLTRRGLLFADTVSARFV